METKTLLIPNISCGHCVMTIQRELSEIKGVRKVEGDSKTRKIQVTFESPADLEQIKRTLREIQYPPEGEE